MTIEQEIINYLFGGICGLGGYLFKSTMAAIKALQRNEAKINDKVNSIEVLVAGSYVKRDEMERMAHALFVKLDKIYDKLDSKQDKPR